MKWLAPMAAIAIALAGCGATRHRPQSKTVQSKSMQAQIQQAQVRHEYPSPAPQRQRASHTARSPLRAVADFADAYINWTAATVAAEMTKLAARSIGQARAATQLAAAQTASDYELKRDGIANSGTVEAIAPLPAQTEGSGRPRRYVVVTREWTTATATTAYEGLQPAWHVAIATVSQLAPGEWVVSEWQPQS